MRQPCPNSSTSPASKASPIPFGLKNGRMVRVQEVANGMACGCTCPACGHPLVAKAKDSRCRRPHFAHYRDAECRAGFETAIHKGAKQLIADRLRVCLPEWDGEVDLPNPPILYDAQGCPHFGRRVEFPPEHVRLSVAVLEQPRGDYIPDVTAWDCAGELLIEIRVSHAVEELKRRQAQSDGVRMLEIDLSRLTLTQALDPQAFEQAVLDSPENRKWLSCPDATEAWRISRDALKFQLIQINQEIAKEKALEKIRLEEYRAATALKEQKKANFRKQLRHPLLKDLEKLPTLVSQSAVSQRLSRFEERDSDAIAEGLGAIESQAVRALLANYHPEAWVYEGHPVLWQLGVYQHFIQGRDPGYRFNRCDVANWIRNRYGVESKLYNLFLAQYKDRCRARERGYRKQRISAWYLTEHENSAIPNFYLSVNWLLDRLMYLGLLTTQKDCIGGLIRI